jgi:ATP-binding protein involved in chromosome partitioning
MNMFLLPQVNVPILGVVENMSWFTPAELPENKYYIFGEGGGKRLARMANSVLMGQIPMVQGIREAGDNGLPAISNGNPIVEEAFSTVIENLVNQIQYRHEVLAPTQKVNVQA